MRERIRQSCRIWRASSESQSRI